MPATIPAFSLTQGQLAWVLNRGEVPPKRMVDQIRYLRQKGVPHAEGEIGQGRGKPIHYGYDELIECGVALFALNHGIKPGDVAKYLVEGRKKFRPLYRQAYQVLPEGAVNTPEALSRGRSGSLRANPVFMFFRGRMTDSPGKIVVHMPHSDRPDPGFFTLEEHHPDHTKTPVLNLTELALELVAWALQAPKIRPGPSS